MNALLLQNTTVSQEQIVPNGNVTVSFKYKKLIELAEVSVIINGREYELTATTDTEFVTGVNNIDALIVSSQSIEVEFVSDTNDACEIYDLMVNAGSVKLAYSQNMNETTTDTVNISKGITITSSDTNTLFKADSVGIRIFDRNSSSSDPTTKFLDTGLLTERAEIKDTSKIVGLLFKEVNGQTWISKL